MASDSNLLKLALAQATSFYGSQPQGMDMSNVYQQNVNINKGYMDLITGALAGYKLKKNEQKQKKDAQLDVFIKRAEEGMQMLYEQELPMPDVFINAVENEIESLQDDFEAVNTIGKSDTKENKRARRVIMGKLNRVTQGIIKTRGEFQKFGILAKDINKDIAPDDIDAAMAVIDLKNWDTTENGELSVSFDENGIPIYTVQNYRYSGAETDPNTGEVLVPESRWGDAVSFKMEDLVNMFPGKMVSFDEEFLQDLTDTQVNGKMNGQDENYDFKTSQHRAAFIGKFQGEDGKKLFHDIANRRLNSLGQISFKEALLDDISIPVNVLDNMFIDDEGKKIDIGIVFKELDRDGSGFIDQKDIDLAKLIGEDGYQEFEATLDIMIDALTNVNNDAFDMNRSAELMADYYIGSDAIEYNGNVVRPAVVGIKQQYYNEAFNVGSKTNNNINNRNTNNRGANDTFMLRQGLYPEIATIDQKINEFEKGNITITDWNGGNWRPDGKGNYISKDYDGSPKLTKGQLMRSKYFSLGDYIDRYKPDLAPKQELLLGMNSTFPDSKGTERKISYYKGKPYEFANALNTAYNTKDFVVEGEFITIVVGKRKGMFDMRKDTDIQALLELINRNADKYKTTY